MNKAELIKAIAEETGNAKQHVEAVLDSLADHVHVELKRGSEIILPGIGKLKVKTREARTGRNPATGAPVEIAAKSVVKFSVAKLLADAVA